MRCIGIAGLVWQPEVCVMRCIGIAELVWQPEVCDAVHRYCRTGVAT